MHLSVKLFLSDMFDQTPHHTLDKFMAKLVPMKNDLQPKGQGHRKNQNSIT